MNEAKKMALSGAAVMVAAGVWAQIYGDPPTERHAWAVHDRHRPRPPVVRAEPGKPPSDAIVLFDGTSTDAWLSPKGEPCKWRIVDGAMEAVPGAGEIRTKHEFGHAQIRIEFMSPREVKGAGQGRGNSGVFIGNHEIQVLDSYENDTYPDGQCSSVYAENPPLVNASRPPGEWQTYDIIFHPAIWEGDQLKHPGTVTVLHNGVLTQDHWVFEGLSTYRRRRPLAPYPEKMPIRLQDHGDLVRFRNIWVREIPSRYANTTHGGPGVNPEHVMALRRETAARLFAAANLQDPNRRMALSRMLEVISYDKTDAYMAELQKLTDAFLKELAGMDDAALYNRRGDIIAVRNECYTLIRYKILPEDCRLRETLQRLITKHELEKRR